MDIAFVTLHKLEIFFSLLLCVAVSFINLCCGEKKALNRIPFYLQVIYCEMVCFIGFRVCFQYGKGEN